MKKILTTVVSTAMFLFVGAGTALAQDEESDDIEATPVEGFTCKYNEGMGRADLDKVNAEWNEWMDDNGQNDYFAAIMTPQYFGELNFDVAWIGGWKDGHAMGSGTDRWLTEGSDLGARYAEVVTCDSHAGYVSLNVRKPPQNDDESDNSFVLRFWNCSIEDGKTFEDYLEAQKAWNAYADENEIVNGAWVWFPTMGEVDDDYDFKFIVSHSDYTAFGANWQKFMDGHWRKSRELFSDLLDCDVSRVYDATIVRRMPMDDAE